MKGDNDFRDFPGQPVMDATDTRQQAQIDRMQVVQNALLLLTAIASVAQVVECIFVVMRGGGK